MKRIFVVGCARSGTTLLQSFVASHEDVAGLTESHFFFDGWVCPLDRLPVPPVVADRAWLPRPSRRWGRARFDGWGAENCGPEEVAAPPIWFSGHGRAFRRLADSIARTRERTGWVEKSTVHIRRVELIRRCCPDALFVHVVRRFPAVLRSHVAARGEHGTSLFDFSEAAIRRAWRRDLRRTLHWIAADPARHFALCYADLCSDPSRWVDLVRIFLGLAPSRRMLQREGGARDVVRDDETWKHNVFAAVHELGEPDLAPARDRPEERLYLRVREAIGTHPVCRDASGGHGPVR